MYCLLAYCTCDSNDFWIISPGQDKVHYQKELWNIQFMSQHTIRQTIGYNLQL